MRTCLFSLQCGDLYFAYQSRRVIEGYMQTSVTESIAINYIEYLLKCKNKNEYIYRHLTFIGT